MPNRAIRESPPAPAREADLSARWAAGLRGRLRLEDGRPLKVVFPGIPTGSSGPDYRDAIVEAGGDLLRGDVELHLRSSGWRLHGHHTDPAYQNVVLHVVSENDCGANATIHASGRAIAILAVPVSRQAAFPPPFVPPCAMATARGEPPAEALTRMGLRRLRIKAERLAPAVARDGAGQALYAAVLAAIAGPANSAAFTGLAGSLPLAVLLERVAGLPDRQLAVAAHLRGAAGSLSLRRAGLRPGAAPERRLSAAGSLIAGWWDSTPCWPGGLPPGSGWRAAVAPGLGRATAIEIMVNAVFPVALASGAWPLADVERSWTALPSPGTYGRLTRLERWLTTAEPPFTTASRLQGGLLLHADYCARGLCGCCPLSSAEA